jgi:hypothetical protein
LPRRHQLTHADQADLHLCRICRRASQPGLSARQNRILYAPPLEGTRHSVTSADGVRIGLLNAGSGPRLLLVHGGSGSSGDADTYELSSEYADVATVAAALAGEQAAQWT